MNESDWMRVARQLGELESLARDLKLSFLLKVDGERSVDVFTVVVSSSEPGGDFLRKDGSDLEALLKASVEFARGRSSVSAV